MCKDELILSILNGTSAYPRPVPTYCPNIVNQEASIWKQGLASDWRFAVLDGSMPKTNLCHIPRMPCPNAVAVVSNPGIHPLQKSVGCAMDNDLVVKR